MSKSYCHIYGQLGQTGDRFSAELDRLLKLGLVCDTDFSFEQAAQNHASLRKLQQRGGLVAPSIHPVDFDPACPDPDWWKYSEAACAFRCGARKLKAPAIKPAHFHSLKLLCKKSPSPSLNIEHFWPENGIHLKPTL